VDAQNNVLTGFEALVRWRHPDKGMIGPDVFIPLAEEIGLIGLIGDWVLRTACRAATRWPESANGKPLQVAVNISPKQLRDGRLLVGTIANALAESGLDPSRLEIEITESALMGDALATVRAIKGLGVELALDDFGTGYSSLSQLAHYPFDRLKIDRSFVRDLTAVDASDEHAARHAQWMLQAIASLGLGLDMEIVAEGVETEEQAALVRAAKVTTIQGYLISRAIPQEVVGRYIRDSSNAGPPKEVAASVTLV
jgi:EAL domain-containing protein (putative c-di-GMP-specific phosphodiesterase class I)